MSTDRIRAWIDLVSPSHPFFFAALLDGRSDLSVQATVRRKTETVDLARSVGLNAEIVGRDFDNALARKLGLGIRTAQLTLRAPLADISLSSRNAMCILASKLHDIPSIHFTDNDITAYVDGLRAEELYNVLEAQATHNVVPAAFERSELLRWGTDPDRIHTYDGYKEDIYVATFEPDERFLQTLPFREYVVIRPEALDAAYVEADRSIVPDLLERFVDRDVNVVYLPRGRGDDTYADHYSSRNVYVPDAALDGLQLAWFSDGVLTGSGTMAREAACMGRPAVSFFPHQLLSVDADMVKKGLIHHSRDPDSIVDYVRTWSEREDMSGLERSQSVYEEVERILDDIIRTELGR